MNRPGYDDRSKFGRPANIRSEEGGYAAEGEGVEADGSSKKRSRYDAQQGDIA